MDCPTPEKASFNTHVSATKAKGRRQAVQKCACGKYHIVEKHGRAGRS